MSNNLSYEAFPQIEEMFEEFATKRTRRRKIRKDTAKFDSNFELKSIIPKTQNQNIAFDYFDQGYNLLLHGSAGTGKTFISIYKALQLVFDKRNKFKKIAIVRSAVPTRDIGFLPGSAKEKLEVYEAPYQAIFTELFGRADAYSILKTKKLVEFIPTSFIRGTTMNETIIIVDECQNLNYHELSSVITRVGENCRIIYSGDFRQTDFERNSEKNGLKDFTKVLDSMKSFKHVEFREEDIVRSGLVKEFIIQCNKLGFAAA